MKRGSFITFEGIEGVGKSTQVRAIVQHYSNQGLRVFQSREPGGSPLSDNIRGVLLSSASLSIDPITELFLLEAARRQHVVDVLQKAVETHDLVICDRYTDSTLAYQGGGRSLDVTWLSSLNDQATGGLKPDLTLLLDLPADVALGRANRRLANLPKSSREDRFENEGVVFHRRVREMYLTLAKKEPGRFFVADASLQSFELTKVLTQRIDLLLKP